MRLAVISDIHGNLPALEAVIADIEQRSVDSIVNLGDLLSGGVQPGATADRLLELDLPTVRGNHERQVLTTLPANMTRSDRLAREEMTARHLEWFRSLPLTLEPAPGVLAFHGSPTDDLTYLLETVEPDGVRPATEGEVVERLGGDVRHALLLCGHTHLQRLMHLTTGSLVLNPGSVGWPAYEDDDPHPHVMEAGSPHARYAVVDDATGRWEAEFLAVEYSWDAAAGIAEGNGRPDVAHALRTGHMSP
jgi:predicted phosphodiesterase